MERGDDTLCKRTKEFQNKMSIKNLYLSLSLPLTMGSTYFVALQKPCERLLLRALKSTAKIPALYYEKKLRNLHSANYGSYMKAKSPWKNKRIHATHVTQYSQKNCIPDSTFPHHYTGFCVERPSQAGGRSECCSHMATQPRITREAFVGGQHIIILQQPQLSSPPGHGELTLYSPSLWLPSCHYGRA